MDLRLLQARRPKPGQECLAEIRVWKRHATTGLGRVVPAPILAHEEPTADARVEDASDPLDEERVVVFVIPDRDVRRSTKTCSCGRTAPSSSAPLGPSVVMMLAIEIG